MNTYLCNILIDQQTTTYIKVIVLEYSSFNRSIDGEVKIEQCTYYTYLITSIHFFFNSSFFISIEISVQMALNMMKYLIEKLTIGTRQG
jgi:hypothetical protein